MEQRLIDANNLIQALKEECELEDYFEETAFYGEDLLEIIENEPTVEPIKGEWIVKSQKTSFLQSNEVFKCKKCGHERSRYDGEILNFCPNCGVQMKGGKKC